MNEDQKRTEHVIWFLRERAKELNCLYRIEELLNNPDPDLDGVCRSVVAAIPPGWQYPDICVARIQLGDRTCASADFKETQWAQSEDILLEEEKVGRIVVCYTQEMPLAFDGPFLKEEKRLLATIADRLSHFIMYSRMKLVFQEYETAEVDISEHKAEEWRVALNLLRHTDHALFLSISRRMLNLLCWAGVPEAEQMLQRIGREPESVAGGAAEDYNTPLEKDVLVFSDDISDQVFEIAARHRSGSQILDEINKWMQQERLSFLVPLLNQHLPLARVIDAVRRYRHTGEAGPGLPAATKRGILVSLIRRFLSDQPQYVAVAAEHLRIEDFFAILDHIVFSADSLGKLGGKSAGLFLAERIAAEAHAAAKDIGAVKVPKTWYMASDGLLTFLEFNNLSEVVEQKYKDLNQVRLEYPHIVQTFKNANLPPDFIQGLSLVLDDFGERPIIVRSSSLLEDRAGSSFSGKYRSLFLANQGSKQRRLQALTEAIGEVYASVFSSDPISYRAERGLLDYVEEMGIMIQEVVGTRVGDYFIPAFAGVAFSRNEWRWSPRIRTEDGLLRLVPGLGTRAVDRTGDDYPILIAPGNPRLRVNVTVDEIVRYSPRKIDVINMKDNRFETVEITEFLARCGRDIPGLERMISVFDEGEIRPPKIHSLDFKSANLVVTFDGLVGQTDFIKSMKNLLRLLETEMKTAVDIEFAFDGKDFYLLQCRPQAYLPGSAPAPIPKDVPAARMIFSSRKHVSNGRVPDATHIIYVDPDGYEEISSQADLLAVGRAIGTLNRILPKRRFILIGPGRWGSRGDMKLGVKVTYSDISNTALLVEVARRKGDYVPDLSFGTHFFQDLVEAEIRYLPLYPDEEGATFNEHFFRTARNILADVIPDAAHLAGALKLIDVPQNTGGLVLRVLMNADLEEAAGILVEPGPQAAPATGLAGPYTKGSDNFWAWRMQMAEQIARDLDPARFGVAGIYIFGSTKSATAGPASDIDLLVHFRGSEEQREDLVLWFEGWSLALAEINYLRTGYRTKGLLDVHMVTDEDIAQKTSYAAKIGAVTDPARRLALRGETLPK
jgi:pyruvate,water dikinase